MKYEVWSMKYEVWRRIKREEEVWRSMKREEEGRRGKIKENNKSHIQKHFNDAN